MAGTTLTQESLVPEHRHHLIRSPSASSDTTTRSTYTSVPHANPSPAYVARKAASDLIATEIEREVLISSPALVLVNEFLDQVLYNILSTSRSTSLSAIKTAIPTVLKPRLGKAALKVAEEELNEYLNDDEEVELHTRANIAELRRDFDPELAWRLARLRCMVYTRLGDLEEEDEEEWLEKEDLRAQLQTAQQFSHATIETGPASAIFLTSILEYLGEQALYYAAQHAQKRQHQAGIQQIQDEEPEFTDLAADYDGVVIGGKDMNHVGRDSPLSRLWRSYRRNTRESTSRPMSPDMRTIRGPVQAHNRTASSAPHEAVILEEERSPEDIPLPMSGNDVNEIEVPGLAPTFSDEEDANDNDDIVPALRRSASMIDMPGSFPESFDTVESTIPILPERNPLRPQALRKRSISSPEMTLGMPSISRRSSPARDPTKPDGNPEGAGQQGALAKQETLSPNQAQRFSLSSESAFGGAVAAVAGALGIGALGIARSTDAGYSGHEKTDEYHNQSPQNTPTKKTAVEEMMGTTPSVAPPKDANTGSSITNMNDFDSMHVPLATTPGPSPVRDLPSTPSRSKRGDYFPLSSKDAQGEAVKVERPIAYQTDGASEPPDNLKPAPLRTMSGRTGGVRPGTADSVKKQLSVENEPSERTILRDSGTDDRPRSSASAAAGTNTPTTPSREGQSESSQIRHTKTDSRGSAKGILGIGRDTTRPGTGNSSITKRFQGKPLQLGDESDEAKKKSLEILIRGNETLHYTLTPAAALRDETIATKRRTTTQDLADSSNNTASRTDDTSPLARSAPLSSNPPDPPSSPRRVVQRVISNPPQGVVSPSSPTRPKNPFGEPREARTTQVTSSMRDLADYARSTGPLDAKQLPQAISPRPASTTSPRLATAAPQAGTLSREPTSPMVAKTPEKNRLKYQARDARPSRTTETSELIDFIREGPPSTGKDREHRIDRKVAPFRTTMDSEDFDNLARGQEAGSSLRQSEDGPPASSVVPSVNSQTPLIISNGRTGKGTIPAESSRQQASEAEGMPKRTRRRIKDPYAHYDSDDDLDDETETGTTRGQEESLIDFLRNTAPPGSKTAAPVTSASAERGATGSRRTSSARETSPHLTQAGSKMDKYRPTQPTHAAHVARNRATQSSPTVNAERNSSKPRFEARDAKASRANTSELAEYLKNSGPAPNAYYQPQPFILSNHHASAPAKLQQPPPKEEKSIFKRFSKTKK